VHHQRRTKMASRLTFGHIVNHRQPKGTNYVLESINNLYLKGRDFGFLYGEHLPHKTALQLYDKIDVLLEQFILGWYGLQAVECMAKGKIVIAWINPLNASCVPAELLRDLPIIYADVSNLETIIEYVLSASDDAILRIGEQGREFVHKWHDAESIATKLIENYKKET